MSAYLKVWASQRDANAIAGEYPALWREIRRFNLPVKLALAAAQRVVPALGSPRSARLVGLAPCRPGSPELRAISRDLDAGFARGSTDTLRVNPIYTLHAIDNLALSALSLRLENREPAVCFGGAAGQAWEALDHAVSELDGEVLVFGGDQSDGSWRGEPADKDASGVALLLTNVPQRIRIAAIEREADPQQAQPHAARGLLGWLDALTHVPMGPFRYVVPTADADGCDRITIVAEVS